MSAPEAPSTTLADPAPTLADRRQPGAGPATTGNNGLIDELLGRLTLEQKVELITGASFWTRRGRMKPCVRLIERPSAKIDMPIMSGVQA